MENALESAAELRDELAKIQDISYLYHEARCVRLHDGSAINVFGSPYSRRNGPWAFGYDGDGPWARLESQTLDILVSHGPAQGLCDADGQGRPDGCAEFLRALERVRPRLVVCGHRHEGRGSVEIAWDSSGSHAVRRWRDPGRGSGRLSLVDLTRPRTGRRREAAAWADDARLTISGSLTTAPATVDEVADWEAESGLSRTCVVNAAIVAKSFGVVKQQQSFNKPIVVDVELGSGAEERVAQ